jgi:hypothetical protein
MIEDVNTYLKKSKPTDKYKNLQKSILLRINLPVRIQIEMEVHKTLVGHLKQSSFGYPQFGFLIHEKYMKKMLFHSFGD